MYNPLEAQGTGGLQPMLARGLLSLVTRAFKVVVFLMTLALIVYVMGAASTVIDPAEAWTGHWRWWRAWTPVTTAVLLYGAMYFVAAEEMSSTQASLQGFGAIFARTETRIVFILFLAGSVLWAAYLGVLVIWLGVDDFGNCAASALCSGPDLLSKPCPGAIMMLVGLVVLVVGLVVLVGLALMIHAGSNQAYAFALGSITGDNFVSALIGTPVDQLRAQKPPAAAEPFQVGL